MAKSPDENAPGSQILRYDLGWRAINDLLRSGRSLSGHERNCCFLNLGSTGTGRFADISAAVGGDLDDDGRVLALSDWDYDGDPDLWIANRSGPQLRYLRNDLSVGKNFIALRLRGTVGNRDAIGARVTIETENGPPQAQTLHAGQGYLAQSSKWLHFGLGDAGQIVKVSVSWPGGSREVFSGVPANSWSKLIEGTSKAEPWQPPIFEALEASALVAPHVSDSARVLLLEPLPLPELGGLAAGIGHARLVSLWADWCAPCLKELKEWSAHSERFAAAKLEVVALNVSETEDLKKWQALEVPFTYRFGTKQLVEEFDALQRALLARQRPLPLPSSFLIDAEGSLRAIYKGPVSADQILADIVLIDKDQSETLAAATPFPGRWHTPPGGSSPTGLAVKFIDGGYTSEAEAYLNSLAEQQHYQSASVFNLLGALLIDRRAFGKAANAFTSALQHDPQNRQAHIELGGLLLGIGKGADAEQHFTAVLATNPNDPELVLKLGVAQMLQNKLIEAKGSMQRAIDLRPSPAAYVYLTKVELALGNSNDATVAYEAGIELHPGLIPSDQTQDLAAIAAAYASIGRFEEAATVLSKAINRDPEIEKQLEEYRRNTPKAR